MTVQPTRPDPLSVVNPLPVALHHYEVELRSILDSLNDLAWESVRIQSAEVGNLGAVRKLWTAGQHLRSLRRITGPSIALWPVLGHLESYGVRGSRNAIIYHDPVPIRAQAGYGTRAIRSGVKRANRVGMVAVAHSRAAERQLHEFGYRRVINVPHPILPPAIRSTEIAPVVRVLGQFKPARDLDLLRSLGPQLRDRGYRTEIVGRGWPGIQGWDVRDEFVDEGKLTQLIASAGAIVIPYRRYWQSGIAIRAFEASVPVVGASGGFLDELYGDDAGLLVAGEGDTFEWAERVDAAMKADAAVTFDHASRYRESGRREWRDLVNTLTNES